MLRFCYRIVGRPIDLLKALSTLASVRLIAPFVLLACVGLAAANAQDALCRETVEAALASIAQNCADLESNSLCYGHPLVEASFADDAPAVEIGSPSQRPPITGLSSVRTGAPDLEAGRWGIAILNLGAMYPRTREGPGIIVMLAGAAEVINEIEPASVPHIAEPLSTATLAETTLFKNPGILPRPLGTAAVDEILLVDATDESGAWLRVVNDGAVAWVERDNVARLNAMDSLPVIGTGAAFPFQALSLGTAADFPACDQAEPMIAIQTPGEMSVNLTVNGVDIHIGAMVTFQRVHRNALSMTVHRGEVTTIFGQTVQQGESVIGILGRGHGGNAQVLDWSGTLPASEAENARGQRAQTAFNDLARVNGWPERKTFKHSPALLHVVERGETLYSIGRLYDTSVAEIILANLGDEPIRLYSGTKLIIPNPGSGFAGQGSVPLDAIREE